jgi:L-alanine-DL-glutamate epimerase-like enolase superfamily enzyme
MREAVGPDVELMCDVHGRLRPSAAIRLGKALEPYDLLFFEEPVPPDTVHSLELVRRAGLSMDIATGERAFTKWGFRDILERQLVDVIQPDICHDGGIKETVKIAAMAEAYEVLVAPHNPNGPVATAASVHAAAVMPAVIVSPACSSAKMVASSVQRPTTTPLAMITRGARAWVLKRAIGLPDCTTIVSSLPSVFSVATILSNASQLRAALAADI